MASSPPIRFSALRADRDDVLRVQSERLAGVVRHAWENVPFYRERFEAQGVGPDDVRTPADLARLPVTTRTDFEVADTEDVIARTYDVADLSYSRTSGSTGEALYIWRARDEYAVSRARKFRMGNHFGIRLGDRTASISLADIPEELVGGAGGHGGDEQEEGDEKPDRDRRRVTIDCLMQPEEIVAELRAYGPDVVVGYAGVLARVADAITGEDRSELAPRLVVSGGEVLTPDDRTRITAGFDARVFDTYGSREFSYFAWECRETGLYHVADDDFVVEVVGEDGPAGPGDVGEVLVTSLHSFAMPFIRYRLGDLATRGPTPCPCGAPWSTIENVQGRMMDYFVLPDGSLMHPYQILLEVIAEARWIRRHRLVQERRDGVVVEAVPLRPPTEEELDALRTRVRNRMVPEMGVEIRLRDALPLEASGKFKLVVSRVEAPTGDG